MRALWRGWYLWSGASQLLPSRVYLPVVNNSLRGITGETFLVFYKIIFEKFCLDSTSFAIISQKIFNFVLFSSELYCLLCHIAVLLVLPHKSGAFLQFCSMILFLHHEFNLINSGYLTFCGLHVSLFLIRFVLCKYFQLAKTKLF